MQLGTIYIILTITFGKKDFQNIFFGRKIALRRGILVFFLNDLLFMLFALNYKWKGLLLLAGGVIFKCLYFENIFEKFVDAVFMANLLN